MIQISFLHNKMLSSLIQILQKFTLKKDRFDKIGLLYIQTLVF